METTPPGTCTSASPGTCHRPLTARWSSGWHTARSERSRVRRGGSPDQLRRIHHACLAPVRCRLPRQDEVRDCHGCHGGVRAVASRPSTLQPASGIQGHRSLPRVTKRSHRFHGGAGRGSTGKVDVKPVARGVEDRVWMTVSARVALNQERPRPFVVGSAIRCGRSLLVGARSRPTTASSSASG